MQCLYETDWRSALNLTLTIAHNKIITITSVQRIMSQFHPSKDNSVNINWRYSQYRICHQRVPGCPLTGEKGRYLAVIPVYSYASRHISPHPLVLLSPQPVRWKHHCTTSAASRRPLRQTDRVVVFASWRHDRLTGSVAATGCRVGCFARRKISPVWTPNTSSVRCRLAYRRKEMFALQIWSLTRFKFSSVYFALSH